MEEIIAQIEAEFATPMSNLQTQIETAQASLSELQAQKQQKIDKVKEYYQALDDMARAEIIIANAEPTLKEQAVSISKVAIK